MANIKDVLESPDFWGDKTTDDDRKFALESVDPKFKSMGPDEQSRFLANQAKTRKDAQQRLGQQQQAAQVETAPRKEEAQLRQTLWQQAVAPVTDWVGKGMEVATEPLVPLARMLQGEGIKESFGPESFKTVGHGGKAGATRKQAGAAVVPQSPWQAGAMAAQFIPGMSTVGTPLRIAASAGGAGALQGLLGEKGLVEGGTPGEALEEGAWGALKGGGTQAAGEMVGKLLGGATRMPGTGRTKRIANADYRNVQKTVGEIAPELRGAGKTAAEGGAFYKGTHAAEEASLGAYADKMRALESELVRTQGHPYITSPDLVAAWGHLQKNLGKNPMYADQLNNLQPVNGGFLPEQAREVLSLLRDTMKLSGTVSGKFNQDALNTLVAKIESTLPASAQGMLTQAREASARSVGLQELMGPAFTAGKGYSFDLRALQKALSENPDFIERLGKTELEKLFEVATRGASKGPGWMDKAASTNVSVPYPSWQGGMVAALRNAIASGKHIGELPGTLSGRLKSLLGVAATSNVSSRSVPKEK